MKAFVLVAAFVVVVGCGGGGRGGPGTVTPATTALACVTATACGIVETNVSVCTRLLGFVNDPEWAVGVLFSPSDVNCLARAGSDCAAAKRCLVSANVPSPSCTASCSGTLLQDCGPSAGFLAAGVVRQFDCA